MMTRRDPKENPARRRATRHPEVRLLDCTVRDGGLMNDHRFDDEIVKAIYTACVEAGTDYMELGYKASKRIFAPAEYGKWKFCSEDDIRRIVGENDTPLKLSVMADAERTDYHEDILPRERSVVDLVRVALYIHQIPAALDIIQDAHDKGYETACNLMAVSTVREYELDQALEILAASEVGTIYLADSYGTFYGERIGYLTKKYLQYARSTGKQVGIHAHNNQMLAYANTIEALSQGATMLDGSMAGLGRGAGNCPIELLLGFLRSPKYHLKPVLQCIQEHIEPKREELLWGFGIPYMITGMLNQHPRAAIQFNAGEDRGNLVKFYEANL